MLFLVCFAVVATATPVPGSSQAWHSDKGEWKEASVSQEDLTSDLIFDQDRLLDWHFTVSDTDLAWLEANPGLEEYVEASLTVRGTTYGGVGLRYKGNIGTLYSCLHPDGTFQVPNEACRKLSFKVDSNEFHTPAPGAKKQKLFGLGKLNFHGFSKQPSMLNEFLAYQMYREVGLPAPRTAFCKMTINGVSHGAYLLVEQINDDFTERVFSEDDNGGEGQLWKEAWPSTYDAAQYEARLKEGDDSDMSAMLDVKAAVDALGPWPTDLAALSFLHEHFDLDQLTRSLAAWYISRDWDKMPYQLCFKDGGLCAYNGEDHWFYNNIYLYNHVQDGVSKLRVITWDTDTSFRLQHANDDVTTDNWWHVPNNYINYVQRANWCPVPQRVPIAEVGFPQGNPNGVAWATGAFASCDRILQMITQVAKPLLKAHFEDLLLTYTPATLHGIVDTWERRLRPLVASDPYFGPSVSEWSDGVDELHEAIDYVLGRAHQELGRLTPQA